MLSLPHVDFLWMSEGLMTIKRQTKKNTTCSSLWLPVYGLGRRRHLRHTHYSNGALPPPIERMVNQEKQTHAAAGTRYRLIQYKLMHRLHSSKTKLNRIFPCVWEVFFCRRFIRASALVLPYVTQLLKCNIWVSLIHLFQRHSAQPWPGHLWIALQRLLNSHTTCRLLCN